MVDLVISYVLTHIQCLDAAVDPMLMGIIPRSTSYIFSEIEDDPHIIAAKVKASFAETYKEKLRDLFKNLIK